MSLVQNLVSGPGTVGTSKSSQLSYLIKQAYPEISEESSPAWRELINHADMVEMAEGSQILEPNIACKQFILLFEGSVRVYQHTPDDRQVTLYRLNPGDLCVLSINSLLRRKHFGAFARTETPVKALVLSKEQFFEAMAVSARFREYVLVSLSDRFHDLLELMETTIFESLDSRLICLLGRMSRASGTDTIHITHQELASELGTSREVVSRLLKGLERKGCISLARGIIQINI